MIVPLMVVLSKIYLNTQITGNQIEVLLYLFSPPPF